MLSVTIERGALQLVVLTSLDPLGPRLPNGDAFAWRGMDAPAHIHGDTGAVGVRILLPLEGLDVAVALAIGVVDDPCFLGIAKPRCPNAIGPAV